KLDFSVESECATCPTATVFEKLHKNPPFLLLLHGYPQAPPTELFTVRRHRSPPCQTRLTAVSRRRRRSHAWCHRREPLPVAGEISPGRSRRRDGFSPAVRRPITVQPPPLESSQLQLSFPTTLSL
ncbi:hypothetical protein PanWU01x14_053750, partial [Parasponia andersonii]